MEAQRVHDFISIYDLEAREFAPAIPAQHIPLWKLLLKATGIFLTITFIVFFIANYHFIRSQIVDWRGGWSQNVRVKDSDGDGLPAWWEEEYGMSDKNPDDALWDGDNDLASNFVEFQFGTDPHNPDTDGDGYLDGEEIENGYNPNGVGRIDSDHDGIPDWWEEQYGLDKNDPSDARKDFDNDLLNNREEYEIHTNPRKFDTDQDGMGDGDEVEIGRNPIGGGLLQDCQDLRDLDQDGDLLTVEFENLFGTDPHNPDTDGDGFDDFREISRGFDPTGDGMVEARLEISALGVDAPVIWSQSGDEDDIINDLDNGVAHYPGSAFPSMKGNSYLTGHSSYYSWSKSPFKEVFKNLGELGENDEIVIRMSLKNGKKIAVSYAVKSSEVVASNDERLFRDYEGSELTLVTCWPLGTDWKRLMVKAELVGY